MLKPGKMQEIANEMAKFDINIIAVQEIRWRGDGENRKKDFSLYYSGNQQKSGQAGTGFFVNKKIISRVIGFEPVTDRLCKLRLRGRFRNITLVTAYAPIENAEETQKETFYDELSTLLDRIPTYDLTIVLGDFNAKIGKEDFVKEVGGSYTLHEETNENGKMLVQLAAANKLIIKSTCYDHKKIHLGTWMIPGTDQVNQIDHVLISARHASSIIDVRACRGPNCDSDHFLVKTQLRERLSNAQKIKPKLRKRWDLEKLKNKEKKDSFQAEVNRKLCVKVNNQDLNSKWERLRNAIVESTQEIIGETKIIKNEWFDEECKEAIAKKNEARTKLQQQRITRRAHEIYNEKRRQANRICKHKKREMIKKKLEEMDKQNLQNEARKFYKGTDWFRKEYKPRLGGCKDKTGKLLGEEEEILARWTEYYRELLNKNGNGNVDKRPEIQTAEPFIRKPTLREVKTAIQRMKNHKAAGEDNIIAEVLKEAGTKAEEELYDLITEIWDKEEMPDAWNIGIITSIYKKGDKRDCSNYRGIMLLNIAYKVFSNILLSKLTMYTEQIIGEYQCGFRKTRSTVDQVFIVRQSMEKCYEHNIDLHMLFVDFRQAFDSIIKENLLNYMEIQGIPKKLVQLTKMTLVKAQAKVMIDGRYGDNFSLSRGVRQGDALSATLFNLALQSILHNLTDNGTIVYKSKHICAYADDIVIIARNITELKLAFSEMYSAAKTMGLEINESKTKYMIMSTDKRRSQNTDVTMEGMTFENVERFVYLGAEVNNCNRTNSEIQRRIMIGNKVYYTNTKLIKSRILSRKTKLKIYKTLIRPVVTYGAETWNITSKDANRLRTFERKIIRRIYGPIYEKDTWRIRTNHEINEIIENEDIVRFTKAQRLRWIGHIERMTEDRIPKRIYKSSITGRRIKGRPRNRWKDEVEADIRMLNIRGWRNVASDRGKWRSVVKQAKAHPEL